MAFPLSPSTANGGKLRYLPVHPQAQSAIHDYLAAADRAADTTGPLFQPIQRPDGKLGTVLSGQAVYRNIVLTYARPLGIAMENFGPHSLSATAATNALEHGADIAKVQDWLGHSDISTTRLYDKRQHRPEDSPPSRSFTDPTNGCQRAPPHTGWYQQQTFPTVWPIL